MLKGSKLYSIFARKCPRCHEGGFFEGSYFKGKPRTGCEKCNLKFEKEPGFFQGSYYVVYALGVATMIAFWVASMVLYPSGGFDQYMWIVLGGMALTFPFIYPLSKIVWANFFYHYSKEALNRKKESTDS